NRAEYAQWLKDPPSQPLQQSLKDPEQAYKNFFQKRAAFPRFKKRGQNDAFRYPQGVKLAQENSRIFLPKPGWMLAWLNSPRCQMAQSLSL
ncbi:transposase, partial [Escherichia coli]